MPSKTAKPPATPATKPDPGRTILKWIIEGQAESDILEAIESTWPNADARPLIAAAIEQVIKSADVNPDLIKGFAIEGTRDVYRKALEVGDFQISLRALKQLVELSR